MSKIHAHYDNLKVARNAPDEVIRAAYMALSKKVHPDLNPNKPEAARIMAIINESYNVLSDPIKRRAHDVWISEQESDPSNRQPKQSQPKSASSSPKPGIVYQKTDQIVSHLFRYWILYGIAGLLFLSIISKKSIQPPPGPRPYVANDPPAPPPPPVYVRPSTAPNGSPWPLVPSYIQGYEKLHRNGLSSITVDNSQNDSDVYVKLVAIGNDRA